MKFFKGIGLGVLLGLMVVACSAFNYVRYGLGIDPNKSLDQQVLLGVSAKDDVPLVYKCSTSAQAKSPCVVVPTDEWTRLRADYGAMEEQLKACQKK